MKILIINFLKELQSFILFTFHTLRKVTGFAGCWREGIEQMYHIGVGSFWIIFVTGLFTGFVLTLQASVEMAKIGAMSLIGEPVATSIVRELGPVLVALMIVARNGSAMTAELASMLITEQIDALEVEGGDPILDLVIPRFLACLMMVPLLTVFGSASAFWGGHIIAVFYLKVSPFYYWNSVIHSLNVNFIVGGLIKSFCFAVIIALIGCYSGLTAQTGAKGLGLATTKSVVWSAISILVIDFMITSILIGWLW